MSQKKLEDFFGLMSILFLLCLTYRGREISYNTKTDIHSAEH